jgi:methyl-accepting chemotaxis protein
MNGSLRIRLVAYVGAAILLVLAAALGVSLSIQRDRLHDAAAAEGLTLATALGRAVQATESKVESHMLAAARAVAREVAKTRLGNDDLKVRAVELGMDDLHLVGRDGVFERASNPADVGFDLFKVLPENRALVDGGATVRETAFRLRVQDGATFKFLSVPRPDGRGLVEVALGVTTLAELAREVLGSQAHLAGIQLVAADGTTLLDETRAGPGAARGRPTADSLVAAVLAAGQPRTVLAGDTLRTYLPIQKRAVEGGALTTAYVLRSEASLAHVAAGVRAAALRSALLSLVLAGLVLGAIVVALSRGVTAPLERTVEVLEAVAAGDLSRRLPVRGRDELARMAAALNTAIDAQRRSLEETRLAGEREQAVQQAAAERERAQAEELRGKVDRLLAVVEAAAEGDLTRPVTVHGDDAIGRMGTGLGRLLAQLRGSIARIASSAAHLASSSEELSATAAQVGANAEETSAQAATVSAAAEQVSASSQTVATGTEEMSASIREIARNATEAAEVAQRGVRAVESAGATVAQLGGSSAAIGEVVKLITSIAEQTNLLALNATIEAARAGEAGKGFAVVASEVKELAKETAKATEDIGRRIAAIRQDSGSVVESIEEVGRIIMQIAEIQTTIAGAVEEQSATTSEMSRNVLEAATGAQEIARNMSGVARAAVDTSSAAQGSRQASLELAQIAVELDGLVRTFRYEEAADGRAALAAA